MLSLYCLYSPFSPLWRKRDEWINKKQPFFFCVCCAALLLIPFPFRSSSCPVSLCAPSCTKGDVHVHRYMYMHIESTCTKGDANSLSCSPFSHSVSGFPSHERPWYPRECSSTFVLYVWSQNDGHSPRMLCIPCPCSPWVITSHSCKPALTVHFPWSLTASLLLPPHILCTDAMYILHSWDAV